MRKIVFIILLFILYSKVYAISNIESENKLLDLKIEGYDINFDKNKFEYSINISDEDRLIINYELADDSIYVCIEGNGNFNKTHNIVTINVNNEITYKINVYKSISVAYVKKNKVTKISNTKKEIVKIIIATISSIIIVCFYYILFINKTIFYI